MKKAIYYLVAFFIASAGVFAQNTANVTTSTSASYSLVEEGQASWYGPEFAGRKTSNGEIYDPKLLTAAHRTLPFGTSAKVTNLDNGKSVIVRVTDRGPFRPGRVIDLSQAAAGAIGIVGSGVGRVRVEAETEIRPVMVPSAINTNVAALVPVSSTSATPSSFWTVQIAAFAFSANAENFAAKLRPQGFPVTVEATDNQIWRVVITGLASGSNDTLTPTIESLRVAGYPNVLVRHE